MNARTRWLWALGIVLADLVVVVLPLAGLMAAYVVVARPAWFREAVEALYRGT